MKNLTLMEIALAPLAGCDRVFGLGDQPSGADAPGTDADAPRSLCAGGMYGGNGGLLGVCLDMTPPEAFAYAGSIRTSEVLVDGGPATPDDCAQVVTQGAGPEVCVIAARRIDIAANLRVTGTRPLVLFALDDLVVLADGTIDVSSQRAGEVGAGTQTADCGLGAAGGAVGQSGGGGGGGAGGTFASLGGTGGAGAAVDGGTTVSAAAGGVPFAVPALSFVRGGCRGGSGGDGSAVGSGGGGKPGGGAVYLIAGGSITIRGTVNASGMGGGIGGQGGTTSGGGGGGGSGGLIGLDAPTIVIEQTARMVANGGGGGGGGGPTWAGSAGLEADPAAAFPFAAAGGAADIGGSGGGQGGDAQSPAGTSATAATTTEAAGGGGGGGAGHIRLYAMNLDVRSSFISPSPQSGPR